MFQHFLSPLPFCKFYASQNDYIIEKIHYRFHISVHSKLQCFCHDHYGNVWRIYLWFCSMLSTCIIPSLVIRWKITKTVNTLSVFKCLCWIYFVLNGYFVANIPISTYSNISIFLCVTTKLVWHQSSVVLLPCDNQNTHVWLLYMVWFPNMSWLVFACLSYPHECEYQRRNQHTPWYSGICNLTIFKQFILILLSNYFM